VMEHDQRVCPRCGEPAGNYRFCQSCRSHIDSLTGIPTRAATYAGDAAASVEAPEEGARLEQALVRLEQAMAAASKVSSDRAAGPASAAALDVNSPPPPPAERTPRANSGAVEITTLPTGPDDRGSDRHQTSRDVARLEDVLSVASPKPPSADLKTAPVETPAAETITPSPVEAPERRPAEKREPGYVNAQALREAFWFEQASARPSNGDGEIAAGPQPQGVEARVESVAPPTESVAPPVESVEAAVESVPPPVESVPPPSATEPSQHAATSPSVARLWGEEPSTGYRRVTLWLFALVALIVLLIGRGLLRHGGHKAA
jgi:hypothetical protein